MAAVNEAGAAEGRGAHALGDAFRQVLRGIQSIQEALLAQERRVEERLRELERTVQEDREATVARAEALASGFEERLHRLQQRMEEMERRALPSEGQEKSQASGVQERLAHLESRVEHLDASTERALQSVLPRVDALLNQLEKPSPPLAPPHPTTSASSSTSGAVSAPPPPSSASASSPAPRPRSPSAGSAAPPPLRLERREELGEQLIGAAFDGGEADVRRLLHEGVDINYSRIDGLTPLMCAVCNSHEDVVSLLIRRGVDVNASDDFRSTALHYASSYDPSGRCASLLIRAGALVDSTDASGQTPLHWAAQEGNEAAARALLAAGASKSVADNEGMTPMDYATTELLRQMLRP